MFSKLKRIVAFSLSMLVMLCGLIACGKDNPHGNGGSPAIKNDVENVSENEDRNWQYLRVLSEYFDGDGNSKGRIEYSYDEYGNQIESSEYDANGSLIERIESSYDDSGNLVKKITYNASAAISSEAHYTYDNDGNQLTMNVYYADGSQQYLYRTDAEGHVLEAATFSEAGIKLSYNYRTELDDGYSFTEIVYYEDGAEDSRRVTTYDANGNEIAVQTFSDGKLTVNRVKTYDDEGRLITMIRYDVEDNSEREKDVYSYRENGDIDVIQNYRLGKHSSDKRYNYDENGNLKELVEYSVYFDTIFSSIRNTYDEKGNHLSTIRSYYDSDTDYKVEIFDYHYQYAYDELGNKVEEISLDENGRQISMTTWKYDENGNELEKVLVHSDPEAAVYDNRYVHVYDEDGRLLCYEYYGHDGTLQEKEVHVYDEFGNKTAFERYGAGGVLIHKAVMTYERILVP